MSTAVLTERVEIFRAIRPLMARYVPPLEPRTDVEGRYEVWSATPIEVEGRKKKDVFFAGLIIQSSYVGFYFMPVYSDADKARVFDPALLALLKGKSCFHVRKLDDALLGHISDALQHGHDLWVERGWIAG